MTSTGTTTTDDKGNTVLLVEDAKTHIEVSKVDIADGEELEGATIQILKELEAGEEETEGKTYIEENGRKYEVVEEWVSSKDAHVVEGLLTGTEYVLREEVAPNGYLIAADTTFTIDETGKVTSTGTTTKDDKGNTVLLVEDLMKRVSATIRKVWNDDGNRDGLRPAAITVNLMANGAKKTSVTLNAANRWTATVANLPAVDGECKDIAYTWEEPAAGAGYTLSGKTVSGTLTTLTNHHGPEETGISASSIMTAGIRQTLRHPARSSFRPSAFSRADGFRSIASSRKISAIYSDSVTRSGARPRQSSQP